ncbi:prolyl oligopeptidase family serine peptidase [Parvularcula maris]|uniref:Prolyl oligopeptidase family serine peptidase n=1 Tax=Parvularcula maris TaxID=2965077 RepID=A0A9X2L663_9PROT|nr:prolyl oligopeptidase family serine peptidase [Parvularcula maris]MCQ8183805.1 prolyl oligopeptidase family serine peptidase [Parvularcula maris]
MKNLLLGAAFAALSIGAASAQSDVDVMKNDPYLWLEEVEGERALDWVRSQNERSLAVLEAHPAYDAMLAEANAILTSDDRVPSVALRGGYAYNFWQDKDAVRGLWRRMSQEDYLEGAQEWETLLDLDALAEEEGENWVYAGSQCLAPDYTRCLLTLSRGGSDAAVVREYDIESKSFVEGGFELPEAKSSVAWLGQDRLLVGTDFGEGSLTASGYPRITKVWQRGTPLSEAKQVNEVPAEDIWAYPISYWDGERYKGGIFHGETFYDYNWLLLSDEGEVSRLPLPKKASLSGFADGDFIIELKEPLEFGGETYKTGALIALSEDMEKAQLIAEGTDKIAIQGAATSKSDVVVSMLDDIEGRMVRFEKRRGKWRGRDIRLPEGGVVGLRTMDPETGTVIATYENPIQPDTFYLVKDRKPEEIRQSPAFFDADGMVVKRYEATSSDGTKIPYTVIAKEETLKSGPAPTVQYGYGGFEISILPTYGATAGKLWVERGGVYVNTNIRGGGEYGPAWHQAGLKGKRQLIYDDFQAISEDLIERGITTKEQLGILGGSNGGLLMGVSMTQRPDLYKGIGIGVPLLDMLRYDKLLAGASWVGEYGDPDNPEERPFLEKISPYQNLAEDADYPRPFFFTSTKDDRVHPGHARKMARLMEEYGHEFLYYENIEGGHGAAANLDQAARRLALQYAYFAGELGLIGYEGE